MSVASNFIIRELTPVDNTLFSNASRCATAHEPPSLAPRHVHILADCPHALTQASEGIDSMDIFVSVLVGALRGAISGSAID